MICRRCLIRASALTRPLQSRSIPLLIRPLSTTLSTRNAAASAPAPQSSSSSSSSTDTPPIFSTPLSDAAVPAAEDSKPSLSACPEGTVLAGLNYFKNQSDPVALADDAYPSWLWSCLEVTVKRDDGTNDDAEAEFCKSHTLI
jgi:large subunit ribosomal protein L54